MNTDRHANETNEKTAPNPRVIGGLYDEFDFLLDEENIEVIQYAPNDGEKVHTVFRLSLLYFSEEGLRAALLVLQGLEAQ